jgi:hypothetical protein
MMEVKYSPNYELPFNRLPSVTSKKATFITVLPMFPLGISQFPSGLEWPTSGLLSNG